MNLSRILKTAVASTVLSACLWAEDGPAAPPAATAPKDPPPAVKTTTQKAPENDTKTQLSRLRGKLLYKKGQIRKLEKSVTDKDQTIASKASDLERQHRELFMAAEPKLAQLYEDQNKLEEQIRVLTESIKK